MPGESIRKSSLSQMANRPKGNTMTHDEFIGMCYLGIPILVIIAWTIFDVFGD